MVTITKESIGKTLVELKVVWIVLVVIVVASVWLLAKGDDRYVSTEDAKKEHAALRGDLAGIDGKVAGVSLEVKALGDRIECNDKRRSYRELKPQIIQIGVDILNLENGPVSEEQVIKLGELKLALSEMNSYRDSLLSPSKTCPIGVFRGDIE